MDVGRALPSQMLTPRSRGDWGGRQREASRKQSRATGEGSRSKPERMSTTAFWGMFDRFEKECAKEKGGTQNHGESVGGMGKSKASQFEHDPEYVSEYEHERPIWNLSGDDSGKPRQESGDGREGNQGGGTGVAEEKSDDLEEWCGNQPRQGQPQDQQNGDAAGKERAEGTVQPEKHNLPTQSDLAQEDQEEPAQGEQAGEDKEEMEEEMEGKGEGEFPCGLLPPEKSEIAKDHTATSTLEQECQDAVMEQGQETAHPPLQATWEDRETGKCDMEEGECVVNREADFSPPWEHEVEEDYGEAVENEGKVQDEECHQAMDSSGAGEDAAQPARFDGGNSMMRDNVGKDLREGLEEQEGEPQQESEQQSEKERGGRFEKRDEGAQDSGRERVEQECVLNRESSVPPSEGEEEGYDRGRGHGRTFSHDDILECFLIRGEAMEPSSTGEATMEHKAESGEEAERTKVEAQLEEIRDLARELIRARTTGDMVGHERIAATVSARVAELQENIRQL